MTRKAHLHGLVGNDAYATKQFHFGNNEQNVQPALAASDASPTGLSPVPGKNEINKQKIIIFKPSLGSMLELIAYPSIYCVLRL